LQPVSNRSVVPQPLGYGLVSSREIIRFIPVVTLLAFWACDWSILPMRRGRKLVNLSGHANMLQPYLRVQTGNVISIVGK